MFISTQKKVQETKKKMVNLTPIKIRIWFIKRHLKRSENQVISWKKMIVIAISHEYTEYVKIVELVRIIQ